MSPTTIRLSPSALARYQACPRSHFYHLATPIYADWVSPPVSAHRRFEMMANLCLAGESVPENFADRDVFVRAIAPIIEDFTRRGYSGAAEVNIETSIAGEMLDALWADYAFHLYARADLAFSQQQQPVAIVDYKFLSGAQAADRYIEGLNKSIQHLFYRFAIATSVDDGYVMYVIFYPQDNRYTFRLHREQVSRHDWMSAFSSLRPYLMNYLSGWVSQKNVNPVPIHDGICKKCLYSQVCEYPQNKESGALDEDAYESLLIERGNAEISL